ncbi:hypothetical protein PLICRDRAFT_39095 [Plicaturopsis crispa FD-325 SS-3]|nr:hypothetical protein PLICRDRAFT_39095 [Plicaturopsis crispa FD-325 SS-3]
MPPGPRKKARTAGPDEDEDDEEEVIILPDSYEPGPSRCLKLWFSDASVVLRAGKRMFRVHRSVLCTHSKVFADMFAIPQAAASQETLNGCPFVHMPDDETSLTHLLQTMYYPSYFQQWSYSFDYISAILRLATKYEIGRIREMAIGKLEDGFPTTLAAFDDPIRARARAHAEDVVIEAIQLAREADVPTILPCAFYYASRLDLETILRGDGASSLSQSDITTCLLGRAKLVQQQRDDSHRFLYLATHRCLYGVRCKVNTKNLLEFFQKNDMSRPITFEVFSAWDMLEFCELCVALKRDAYLAGRKESWRRLPECFELGTWESLDKAQNP